MRYSFYLRLLATSIGSMVVGIAFAMPPAPPGPYQSIEDALLHMESASQPVVRGDDRQATAREIAREQVISKQTRDWNWGAPSIRYLRENDPALMMRRNAYPPVKGGSGYPSYPNPAPR